MEAFSIFAKRYPVLLGLPLTWGHMDAYAHLNNVQYFRLFESSRLAHFQALMRAAPPGLDKRAWLEGKSSAGPILAATACRFRAPLTFPDALVIGSSVCAVGDRRFTLQHGIFSHKLGVTAAEGTGEVVLYNYPALKKASEFPPALREAIAAVEATAATRSAEELERVFRSTGGEGTFDLV